MKRNYTAWIAWGACALIILAVVYSTAGTLLSESPSADFGNIGSALGDGLVPILFAVVGALVLSKQPRNVIGWLLILPAFAAALNGVVTAPLRGVTSAPADPSLAIWLALVIGNSIWVLFVFPLFFIALLFPNGSVLSPRWRWVIAYGLGLIATFFLIASFAEYIGPDPGTYGVNWQIRNPIGFLSQETTDAIFGSVWGIALAALTLLSVLSLALRFRRADVVQRAQLKWLLAACGFFALSYVPGVMTQGEAEGTLDTVLNALFAIGALGFPIAIGIAILRYHLFDIDVIIRRTVTYAIVVALLLFVYFGSVILLQQVFANLTGLGSNEIITVLSTLAIAALFVPLRNKIQDAIDRRFNRKKYNAQKVLEKFGETVRDETDLDKLTNELVKVVNETMQPRSVSVWLKREDGRQRAEK